MSVNFFSPSEYTAALLHQLRRRCASQPPGKVLEIGIGSGVVLAAMLGMGAQHAVGVDIEWIAVEASRDLLDGASLGDRACIMQGDMWQPCRTERFDLIASNPPQFAAECIEGDNHLPTWSAGGRDGRRVVDRFLLGLPHHLAAGGVAVMTHNVFLDVEKTRSLIKPFGLQAAVVASTSVTLSPQKLASLTPEVMERWHGKGLHTIGNYCFVDVDVLEISWKPDAAPPG